MFPKKYPKSLLFTPRHWAQGSLKFHSPAVPARAALHTPPTNSPQRPTWPGQVRGWGDGSAGNLRVLAQTLIPKSYCPYSGSALFQKYSLFCFLLPWKPTTSIPVGSDEDPGWSTPEGPWWPLDYSGSAPASWDSSTEASPPAFGTSPFFRPSSSQP